MCGSSTSLIPAARTEAQSATRASAECCSAGSMQTSMAASSCSCPVATFPRERRLAGASPRKRRLTAVRPRPLGKLGPGALDAGEHDRCLLGVKARLDEDHPLAVASVAQVALSVRRVGTGCSLGSARRYSRTMCSSWLAGGMSCQLEECLLGCLVCERRAAARVLGRGRCRCASSASAHSCSPPARPRSRVARSRPSPEAGDTRRHSGWRPGRTARTRGPRCSIRRTCVRLCWNGVRVARVGRVRLLGAVQRLTRQDGVPGATGAGSPARCRVSRRCRRRPERGPTASCRS